MDKIVIRSMTRKDLDLAVEWAAAEGWNPGLHDADSFFVTDPEVFFMAWLGAEPVGCISAVAYDEHFGFIGFFIVKPAYRGHRVGPELGATAIRYLGARNIGQDGVEAKIKDYEHFGFKLAYNNIRFEGVSSPANPSAALIPINQVPFEQLAAFDDTCFPVPRRTFLSAWLRQTGSTGWAKADRGILKGFGIIRPCRKGFKVGPLFALDPISAKELLQTLTGRLPPGAPYYLDIPAPNTNAMALARDFGLAPVFKTARMYNQTIPPLPLDRIYGVTTFELG